MDGKHCVHKAALIHVFQFFKLTIVLLPRFSLSLFARSKTLSAQILELECSSAKGNKIYMYIWYLKWKLICNFLNNSIWWRQFRQKFILYNYIHRVCPFKKVFFEYLNCAIHYVYFNGVMSTFIKFCCSRTYHYDDYHRSHEGPDKSIVYWQPTATNGDLMK